MTDDQILLDAKEAFKLASETESDNRHEALDDIRFARLAEQWPDAAKRQRELELRPCLTINRMPAFLRQVLNDARQNRPSISCHPVDDKADVETAKIINGLIRNIEYTSNADVAYDTALDFAVTGGFGYWRVKLDYAHDDTFDVDILVDRVSNPFSIYGDPHSTSADSSDWNSAFVVDKLTRDEFKRKYKGAEEVSWDEIGYGNLKAPWIDGEQILVAEWWQRTEESRSIVLLSDGSVIDEKLYKERKDLFDAIGITVTNSRDTKSWKVTQHILTGAEVLETNDWAGRYIPIVPVYGDEVNVEGKRYFRSMVRDAKDAQRMYNYWRTTSTEMIALAPKTPFIGPKGAFNTDIQKWATANVSSHPFIEYDGQIPPQRQPFAGPPAGALQEALNASDDMKAVMGIYDASLGNASNETSGRAILARQREGDIGTFHFIDNLSRAIRHTGRILIDLIPSVYTGQRMIRILGPEGDDPQNIKLNTLLSGPDGSQRIYDLSTGKYDLTVETGPSFTTRREEAATQMIELIRANPQVAPLIGDLLAKNLDWPGADEIAERLKTMLPPQLQGQNPQMQQAQQAIEQLKAALQQQAQQVTSLKMDKTLEADKLKIDAYEAETDRLKLTQIAMGPEQVQALVLQTFAQILNAPNPMPQSGGQAGFPFQGQGVVPGPIQHDPLSRSTPEQPRMAVPQ